MDDQQAVQSPAHVVRFVNSQARTKTVTLAHPLECDGRVISAVTVKRLTVGEIASWIAGDVNRLPMYADQDGNLLPDAVIDNLDADDWDLLQKAAADFLPQRLRESSEQDATTQPTSDTSASSSAESPAGA